MHTDRKVPPTAAQVAAVGGRAVDCIGGDYDAVQVFNLLENPGLAVNPVGLGVYVDLRQRECSFIVQVGQHVDGVCPAHRR